MAALIVQCRTKLRFKPFSSLIQSFRSSAAATDTKETGLYGFDHLKTPKGFQRFVDDAIERSVKAINK